MMINDENECPQQQPVAQTTEPVKIELAKVERVLSSKRPLLEGDAPNTEEPSEPESSSTKRRRIGEWFSSQATAARAVVGIGACSALATTKTTMIALAGVAQKLPAKANGARSWVSQSIAAMPASQTSSAVAELRGTLRTGLSCVTDAGTKFAAAASRPRPAVPSIAADSEAPPRDKDETEEAKDRVEIQEATEVFEAEEIQQAPPHDMEEAKDLREEVQDPLEIFEAKEFQQDSGFVSDEYLSELPQDVPAEACYEGLDYDDAALMSADVLYDIQEEGVTYDESVPMENCDAYSVHDAGVNYDDVNYDDVVPVEHPGAYTMQDEGAGANDHVSEEAWSAYWSQVQQYEQYSQHEEHALDLRGAYQ